MISIEKPTIEFLDRSVSGDYAKFSLSPLNRGYGTTLGNSMRRILLSSLEGVAPTSIKIDGVVHEFSTIPGVKEDVTEIILNIKNIAAKLYTDGPKTVILEGEGECELTALDIREDSEVEIMNPDLHIATLNKEAKLYMEIILDKGIGYIASEQNKHPGLPVHSIPVDSIYTPVKKVNATVDNMRIGNKIDHEKLTVEVWTNGVLTADEAVSWAAKILCEHLSSFVALSEEAKNSDIMVEKEEDYKEKVLEMTIEELDLSVRSYNCLKRAGINTVEDLSKKTQDEMIKVRNLGRKSMEEVIAKLEALGLTLAEEED
jgi:DNA-directed RNA polymerase subunit alpha